MSLDQLFQMTPTRAQCKWEHIEHCLSIWRPWLCRVLTWLDRKAEGTLVRPALHACQRGQQTPSAPLSLCGSIGEMQVEIMTLVAVAVTMGVGHYGSPCCVVEALAESAAPANLASNCRVLTGFKYCKMSCLASTWSVGSRSVCPGCWCASWWLMRVPTTCLTACR